MNKSVVICWNMLITLIYMSTKNVRLFWHIIRTLCIPKYISSFVSHIEKITNVVCLVEIVGCTLHMCLLGYYCILVRVLWNMFAAHYPLLERIRECFLGLEPRRKRRYSAICYNIDLGYFQHLYILLHRGDLCGTGNGNVC